MHQAVRVKSPLFVVTFPLLNDPQPLNTMSLRPRGQMHESAWGHSVIQTIREHCRASGICGDVHLTL